MIRSRGGLECRQKVLALPTSFSFSSAGTSNGDSGCRPLIGFSRLALAYLGGLESALHIVKPKTMIALWQSRDFKEGITAFFEKRPCVQRE